MYECFACTGCLAGKKPVELLVSRLRCQVMDEHCIVAENRGILSCRFRGGGDDTAAGAGGDGRHLLRWCRCKPHACKGLPRSPRVSALAVSPWCSAHRAFLSQVWMVRASLECADWLQKPQGCAHCPPSQYCTTPQVCADRNKPDGQFVLPATLDAVSHFISELPIRKVPGIGKVLVSS